MPPCLPCKGLQFSGEESRWKCISSTILDGSPKSTDQPPPHGTQRGGVPWAGKDFGTEWQCLPPEPSFHASCSIPQITSLLIHRFPEQAVSSLPTCHSSHTGSLPAPITLLHIWVLSVPAVSFFEMIQPQHNELKAIFSWKLSQKSLKDTPVLHNICCLSCRAMWKE